MNALVALPAELRLAGLFLVGLVLGSFVNWGIYALAWLEVRPISPWQRPDPKGPPRRWTDFVPVLGWLGLARETAIHGAGFWIRPLLMELACGLGLAGLYQWETTGQLAPPIAGVIGPTQATLHLQCLSHALLCLLMLVATFIDFDEQTIPDEITIPGTLMGLVLAGLAPNSHLPVVRNLPWPHYGPLLLTSTDAWPAWLDSWRGAALGVAIFVAWCTILIPATCTLRRGLWKAVQFCLVSIARGTAWWKMLLLAIAGSAGILTIWQGRGSDWQALLTSLVGLAFGAALVWAVRLIGQFALHKEAMGFGDVTLMVMIGAFLGWHACLMVFFLSPFAALIIALAQWVLTRRRDIAFGPYLCLAAVVVIAKWPVLWGFVELYFAAGWLVPGVVAACLLLMMGLLMLWRIVEQALFDTSPKRKRG